MSAPPKPPKSYDREGGQKVKLARYARWFGVFLMVLTVLAWLFLQDRPAVSRSQLRDAVEWAESVQWEPCERPVLFGEAIAGEGTDLLQRVFEANGCLDETCSTLRRAVQHERVCSPQRPADGPWLEDVVARIRAIDDPREKLEIGFAALRAVDDTRRGEQRAFNFIPPDTSSVHGEMVGLVRFHPELMRDPAVQRAANTLRDTSPPTHRFIPQRHAGIILGPLERGRIRPQSHTPYPRAGAVSLAILGKRVQRCAEFECVRAALRGRMARDEPGAWSVLLQGPRARGATLIADTTNIVLLSLAEDVEVLAAHRSSQRMLAVQIMMRADPCRPVAEVITAETGLVHVPEEDGVGAIRDPVTGFEAPVEYCHEGLHR